VSESSESDNSRGKPLVCASLLLNQQKQQNTEAV